MENTTNLAGDPGILAAPQTEPDRQFYFMDLCRDLVSARAMELGRPLTASVQTFGCQMNARDSEKLLGILEQIGFVPREDEEADLVLYNTCTVRDNANQRVYGRLGYVHSLKKKIRKCSSPSAAA